MNEVEMALVEHEFDPSEEINLIILIDTCFLLKIDDSFLEELHKVCRMIEKIKIIIPWKVLKELEGISGSNKNVLGFQARKISRHLFTLMQDVGCCIMGQRLDETFLNLNESFHSPDDVILDCCEYFARYYPNAIVSLFTKDTNLALKAAVHGFLVVKDWDKPIQQLIEHLQSTNLMVNLFV